MFDSFEDGGLQKALREPVEFHEFQFKLQSVRKSSTVNKGIVTVYVDARSLMERLDAVVGCQGWHYDTQDLLISDKMMVAKCSLTVLNITKVGISKMEGIEAHKGSDSDSLKRAGMAWGFARDLYYMPELLWPVKEWKPEKFYLQYEDRLHRQMYELYLLVAQARIEGRLAEFINPKPYLWDWEKNNVPTRLGDSPHSQQSSAPHAAAATGEATEQQIKAITALVAQKGIKNGWATQGFFQQVIGRVPNDALKDLTAQEALLVIHALNELPNPQKEKRDQ